MPFLASTTFCCPTQPHLFTVNLPVHPNSITYLHIHTFSVLPVIIYTVCVRGGRRGGQPSHDGASWI